MKKGFTLIELLAVILILGIIALIAIPTVNNIIKESKKGSFKTTAANIVRTAEQQCQMEKLRGDSITKYYRFEDKNNLGKLGIKGDNPSDGSVVVDDECNVDLVLNQDNYIAIKAKNDDKVEIIENKYYKPGEEITYNPGDSNYNTWNVIKDNGNTITLLSTKDFGVASVCQWASIDDYEEIDTSITADDYYIKGNTLGPITIIKKLNSLTSSWNSEAKANIRLITKEDLSELLGINNINDSVYFDTKTNVAPTTDSKKYKWLYADQVTYWTGSMDLHDDMYVYTITKNGLLLKIKNHIKALYNGKVEVQLLSAIIRPVITIPKSSLS